MQRIQLQEYVKLSTLQRTGLTYLVPQWIPSPFTKFSHFPKELACRSAEVCFRDIGP